MQLASFTFEGRDRIGVRVDDDHLVDLALATGLARSGEMIRFIAEGDSTLTQARELVRYAHSAPGSGWSHPRR